MSVTQEGTWFEPFFGCWEKNMDPIFQTYLSHLLPLNLRTILGPGLASLFHVVGPQIPDFWCWRWWRPDVVFSRVFHISQLGSFQRYLSFLSFLHSFHSYIFSLQSVLFSYHSFFFRFLRPSSLEKQNPDSMVHESFALQMGESTKSGLTQTDCCIGGSGAALR